MMLFEYQLRNFNIRILIYMLMLSSIGIMAIWSATNQNEAMVTKQIAGIFVGMTMAVALAFMDYHKIASWSMAIYIVCVIILAAVLMFGNSRGIATRWIELPVIGQVQPSEFVKVGMILFFSWYLTKYQEKINQFSVLFGAFLMFAVPIVLILRQPNLSTVLVITAIITSLVFVSGLSMRWILSIFAVLIPISALFIYLLQYEMIPFLENYQARRILAWIDNEKYAEAYYQQENSIIAIGSGQFWGKGLNTTEIASVKNGNFLSVEESDFIFAIIGEELGFIGCIVVMILFVLIVYECLLTANKSKDMVGRLICTGMATWLAFQGFANIAVATGIFPNTGLPLPFISYGVSSLLSIYIGMGLVLNVSLQRKKQQ